MQTSAEITTLIIDIGTEYTKIGYSTSVTPSTYKATPTNKESGIPPLKHSKIVDTEGYLNILSKELCAFKCKTILVCLNNEENAIKEKILDHLFSNRIANNVLFCESRLLDLFSYGKTTGIVISLSSSLEIVGIADGAIFARKTVNFGSCEIRQMFKEEYILKPRLLRADRSEYDENEIARDVMEYTLAALESKPTHYELPNRDVITVDRLRSEPVDIMLRDVQEMVKEVVEASPSEIRNVLLSNIVLSGGCAGILGMIDRITNEVGKVYPPQKVKVSYEKNFHTFLGGSVFGSLGTVKSLFISFKEYEEKGPEVLTKHGFESL